MVLFLGIAALNPDQDPVKEKYPGTFRGLVKLDCVSLGSKYSRKESEDKKLEQFAIYVAGC